MKERATVMQRLQQEGYISGTDGFQRYFGAKAGMERSWPATSLLPHKKLDRFARQEFAFAVLVRSVSRRMEARASAYPCRLRTLRVASWFDSIHPTRRALSYGTGLLLRCSR